MGRGLRRRVSREGGRGRGVRDQRGRLGAADRTSCVLGERSRRGLALHVPRGPLHVVGSALASCGAGASLTVAGLLLAAGEGRRMGLPKALLADDSGVPYLDRAI